ncbi:MAG: hypothetical protein JWN89_692 [Parcubacteria group bacterium]|nr:hypothetical protein [Parcubacteria group bacterium]
MTNMPAAQKPRDPGLVPPPGPACLTTEDEDKWADGTLSGDRLKHVYDCSSCHTLLLLKSSETRKDDLRQAMRRIHLDL